MPARSSEAHPQGLRTQQCDGKAFCISYSLPIFTCMPDLLVSDLLMLCLPSPRSTSQAISLSSGHLSFLRQGELSPLPHTPLSGRPFIITNSRCHCSKTAVYFQLASTNQAELVTEEGRIDHSVASHEHHLI